MKKLLCGVLLLSLMCVFVGCALFSGENVVIASEKEKVFSEQNAEISESVITPATDNSAKYTKSQYSNTDYTAYEFKQNHIAYLDTFIKSGEATKELQNSYNISDNIETVPILGTYLEETNLVTYLFYTDGEFSSAVTLSIEETSSEIKIGEFFKNLNAEKRYGTVDDEYCFSKLSACMKNHANFEIKGLVYSASGYTTIYPVGCVKGENTLKYIDNDGEIKCFNLVDPFSSIEEGRVAFEKFLKTKQSQISSMTIFEWDSGTEYTYTWGFMRWYQDENALRFEYLNDFDNMIVVPLLDENGNEGVYILHLLYYHNTLIGEIVLKQTDGAPVSVWENISTKNSDGTYKGIEICEYSKIMNEAKSKDETFVPTSVTFSDNTFVPNGFIENEFYYYNVENSTFVKVK